MTCRRSLAVFIALALVVTASTASADMTFQPDEVYQDDDDGEMTFAPDDLAEDEFDAEAEMDEDMDVGVVAVPGDDITAGEREELQQVLRDAAREIPEITTYGDGDLLPRLEERDPDYCSREALCLASVGESAAVQRVLQARVEREPNGNYRLDIDYFDVDNRLFVAYHSNSRLGSFDDVLEAVPPGVDDIFGIRRDVGDDPFVDDREVDVTSVMAYSTAGAAVASLATGVLFGMQVNNQQSELEAARDEDGRFTDMTQREAHRMQRSMENSALTANVFYGLSAGLAAASIGLFVLSSGDDDEVAAGDDDTTWYRALEVTPRFGGESVGIGAHLRF